MIKRALMYILSFMMIFAFAGCNNNNGEKDNAKNFGNYESTGDRIVDPQDLSEEFLPYRSVSDYEWYNYNETYKNYPFFTDKEDAVTYAVNGMWENFSHITKPDDVLMVLGHEPPWYEWISRMSSPSDNDFRNQQLLQWVVDWPVNEDGYLWSWYESPHWWYPYTAENPCVGIGHNYHYDNNPSYIVGVENIMAWQGNDSLLNKIDPAQVVIKNPIEKHHESEDKSLGMSVRQKVDGAMNYMMNIMNGKDGLMITDEQNDGMNKGGFTDYGSNYWDVFRFGYKDAYANMWFYRSLFSMASIERMCGNETEAQYYEDHAVKVKKAFNDTFWDKEKKRYICTVNKDNEHIDFGATFLNLQIMDAGLADVQQTQYIYSWLIGNRIIESDMAVIDDAGTKRGSVGKDIYHFKFAPRANTVPIESVWKIIDGKKTYWQIDWEGGMNFLTTHQYGYSFQNGGAIFYPTYYDILNRIKYVSPDNALNRLKVIASEYALDELIRHTLNPYGWDAMVGIVGADTEFMESGLIPMTYLYGFIGLDVNSRGFNLNPAIPSDYELMGMKDVVYGTMKYDVTVHKSGKVEFDAQHGINFKLNLKNYANKASYDVKVYRGNVVVKQSTVFPNENGEFVVDLTGDNGSRQSGRVVIE